MCQRALCVAAGDTTDFELEFAHHPAGQLEHHPAARLLRACVREWVIHARAQGAREGVDMRHREGGEDLDEDEDVVWITRVGVWGRCAGGVCALWRPCVVLVGLELTVWGARPRLGR